MRDELHVPRAPTSEGWIVQLRQDLVPFTGFIPAAAPSVQVLLFEFVPFEAENVSAFSRILRFAMDLSPALGYPVRALDPGRFLR